jgi:hypothetical protein
MPIVSFESLPDSARVWVFASDHPLHGAVADTLLAAVDRFLSEWKAHGVPLRCARDWRDDRFLAVAVDINAENASGCSIDGLFHSFRQLEREIGARLVGGGRVFYRRGDDIETTTREEFIDRARRGEIAPDTIVFDTGLVGASAWRNGFEHPAREGWSARLFA